MKKLIKSPKMLLSGTLSLFFLAVILFWIKTYIAYQIEFDLGIDNGIQKFLLFINPLSSTLLFLGFALLFKKRGQNAMLLTINFIMSFLLYANIVYYRFFSDFITVPVLLQTKTNAGQLGDSVLSLMSLWDVFYFTDTILLILLLVFKQVKPLHGNNRRPAGFVLAAAVIVFLFNLGLAEKDRPDLLTRSFDRNYLVKYLGAYNFTIYDIVQNARSSSQRAMADSSDIVDVENYIKANHAAPNPEYFGKAAGKNVIYVSMESLQSFIIDYKINDLEVMPYLNSLVHSGEAFYFPNLFHQTGQGKTSDAEFMMENSLFPMSQGAVFVNKAQNTYQAMPGILKGYGYTSAAFHGNYKTFWNRNVMYKAFGYDDFFDAEYYDMSEENTKNYGMKDIPFFEQSMPMLTSLKQPFYSKFIMLSNHFPFEMDEGDTDFPKGDFADNDVVNSYFQSAHYMDQALEKFFNDLKAAGLYENTIIVLYGDHYGISENHNEAMAEVLGKEEITPFDTAQLQRVPVFIVAPGVKGGVIDAYGGQVDVMPTVLHLLGIDTKDYMQMGTDLLSPAHQQVVPFRNGNFVTPEYTVLGGKTYSNATGEIVEGVDTKELENQVSTKLSISDEIVTKDLLRFYTPEGFTPIDPKDYEYIKNSKADK
ncbi:LTA synthase family protein [Bacillus sp. DNRA2]|uniref:LTA synthase family protein n=1 Tax=Bacillus sp. DNRA2 TaxID=2723053 RepID=UPI00145EF89A|nr:LTA synthase family protein [Bacillus sp. DNRA2]NMD69194.1 LTA synthase family protein [Bacillus sp. DNRA2]